MKVGGGVNGGGQNHWLAQVFAVSRHNDPHLLPCWRIQYTACNTCEGVIWHVRVRAQVRSGAALPHGVVVQCT